jgi:Domain of Unknown Function (DUF748)
MKSSEAGMVFAAPGACGGDAMRLRSRAWRWAITVVIAAILLSIGFVFMSGELLRRYVEREVNTRLTGYTVRIGALDVFPLRGAFELRDWTIVQDARPDPPVASIDRLRTTLDWSALRQGRIVADILFERPRLHVDLKHVQTEAKSDVALKDRGWQHALQATALDLEINRLLIVDGDVTYVDRGPFKPLRLSQLNITAENIRNIRAESGDRVYPSDVRVDGVVFDSGRLRLQGQADFLAVPHPGVMARFELDRVELDYFRPLTDRANLSVRKGILTAAGITEYSPKFKMAVLERVRIDRLAADYVHKPQTAALDAERARSTARAAQSVSNDRSMWLKIDQLNVVRSDIGFVNQSASPPYRVVLTDTDIAVENLSNQDIQGDATVRLKGKLQGTGDTEVRARMRPKSQSGDMDLTLQVEEAALESLRDLARAYGRVDVSAGALSMYADLRVRGGTVDGYIKPVVRDLEVSREAPEGFQQKLRDALTGLVAKVLRNRPRREIVTVVNVSGQLDRPRIDIWPVVRRLLENAFIAAIYPGFDYSDNDGRIEQLTPKPPVR